MKPVIKINDLGKRYRLGVDHRQSYRTFRDVFSGWFSKSPRRSGPKEHFWAVRHFDLEVNPGEVVGVIGRNGAGKSTLLKLIAQITRPTEGRIELRGRVASLLEVGTGFHPELTGRENVFVSGAILGMRRQEILARFDKIVDFAGVSEFLDTPVKRYSSGMQVRLAFSVAAHLEQDILLVDEVLAVGDADFRKRCLGKMDAVAKKSGRTVIFVSHNMSSVAQLCGRGVVMADGKLQFDGPIDQALSKYSNHAAGRYQANAHAKGPHITYIDVDHEASLRGELRVKVGFKSDRVLDKPNMGLVLCDELGAPIFGFNTQRDKQCHFTACESGELTFKLDKPPIYSGQYFASIWFSDGHEVLEKQEKVISVDYLGSEYLPASLSRSIVGNLAVNAHWQIDQLD